MAEEEPPSTNLNFSDIDDSEINIGSIITGTAGADLVGRDKTTIGQIINNFFTGAYDLPRRRRNRQVLLAAVRKFWVEGVLEQSLHGAALIELGMVETQAALAYPWQMVLRQPDRPNRPLPAGTPHDRSV
jgi:hypothetical protein